MLGSDEEILKIEARIFQELIERIAAHYAVLKETSLALARLGHLGGAGGDRRKPAFRAPSGGTPA